MAQASANSEGQVLHKHIAVLAAETDSAAHQQQVLQAVQNPAHATNLVVALGYLPGLVDAYAVGKGQAALDSDRPSPINFVTLDLIRQAESGNTPPCRHRRSVTVGWSTALRPCVTPPTPAFWAPCC